MNFVHVTNDEGVAIVVLDRGKVNAINGAIVKEIASCLDSLENDETTRAIILTGRGKFFSFGFDIPEFLSYSRDSFAGFLSSFTNLYTKMFIYPKPIVVALNGHTIAGGCMLATACDYRIMVAEKAKISLNEITFGASVFAGSVEMLKFIVGSRNAESILFSGAMYSAQEAKSLGLIDEISSEQDLTDKALHRARDYSQKSTQAFRSLKNLLRQPVAREMIRQEQDSIRKFVDIWYSEKTWSNLKQIKIRS